MTATGPRTEFGRIGQSLASLETEKTRLQSETTRIVKAVAVFAIALSLLLAAYHIATRGDWLAGILAGITPPWRLYGGITVVRRVSCVGACACGDGCSRAAARDRDAGAATVLCGQTGR